MPSPFPGMDPYLEHAAFFPHLHGMLISELHNDLQERLPPAYYVTYNTRVWVEYSERIIEPDVGVARMDGARGGNGTAVAVPIQPVIIEVPNDETTETFLEIRTVQDDQRLITMIEVLSPNNKAPGNEGRDLYKKTTGSPGKPSESRRVRPAAWRNAYDRGST